MGSGRTALASLPVTIAPGNGVIHHSEQPTPSPVVELIGNKYPFQRPRDAIVQPDLFHSGTQVGSGIFEGSHHCLHRYFLSVIFHCVDLFSVAETTAQRNLKEYQLTDQQKPKP